MASGGGGGQGEIALSVEETNRLRAEIGLKPLKMDDTGGDKQKQPGDGVEEDQQQPDAQEMRERIAASRSRRARDEIAGGKGLGEILAGEEGGDAADWVAKMRQKEAAMQQEQPSEAAAAAAVPKKKERRARPKAPKMAAEDELAGLRVAHDMKAFGEVHEGEDVVLTLADKPIIGDDAELAEGPDELENIAIREKTALDKKLKDKEKTTVYDPTEDWQIGPDGLPRKKDVLEHYDEWAAESSKKKTKTPGGFFLSALVKGDADISPAKKLDLLTQSAQQSYSQPADFYTKEEMAKFNKPRRRKEKKNARRKVDWEELLGEGEEEDRDTGERHAGSRASQAQRMEAERPDSAAAVAQTLRQLDQSRGAAEGEAPPEDEDDRMLYEQLARQRRIALAQQEREKKPDEDLENGDGVGRGGAEEYVRKVIEGDLVKKEEEEDVEMKAEDEAAGVKKEDESNVELSAFTEFIKSLQTPEEKFSAIHSEGYTGSMLYRQQRLARQRKLESRIKGERAGQAEPASAPAAKEKAKERTKDKDDEQMADAAAAAGGAEEAAVGEGEGEEESDEDEDEELLNDSAMDVGLASALSFLKSRGELSDDAYRLKRHHPTLKPMHMATDKDDIKIEYRDDYGRVMNEKEAFQYISWTFHGKKPGKRKLERMMMKQQNEKRLKEMDPSEVMPTMRALKKMQEQEGAAHLRLTGTNNSLRNA
ncbi:unnamed protein product [Vitrella brassicaformis CCMP3155]|uniref:SART-1 family protein n=1 Tax=Vitrella brassicaformis (strain CCMP3155) TaxID=1169540 RepID=A0A0G4EMA0_VITBC|nr:unnamed protein product [Vitrella brassicaformis CCMP3155]|mmetsp:Transcript_24004/g.69154  ORF Transcript_24004/g.69154 Transcript_24004/m.69154 type:complete len:707 (-) Transcript_24004:1008-3128(-)|eukprot:CEL98289.1 unnamed protein product [Vitrella brassicaformis CCMP3155]